MSGELWHNEGDDGYVRQLDARRGGRKARDTVDDGVLPPDGAHDITVNRPCEGVRLPVDLIYG